jgi:hypothetical protein
MGYHSRSIFPRGVFFALESGRRKKEMRFMKKFLTLGLVAVLGMALVTGCKKKEEAAPAESTTTEAPAVVEETGTTATSTATTATTTTETTTTTTATTSTVTPKM